MSTAFGTGVTGSDGRLLDQVRLGGVSARGYHGVLPSERQTGQEFRADVVLYMDTRPAAAGDDLAQTVSYADVAQDVHDILTGEPADLVETVAERIAAAALARQLVQAVDVRVHKPHAPIPVPFADVEVAIRRDRTIVPVVAPPVALVGLAAQDLPEPDLAAPLGSYAALEPEPQDFQPVARPVADEPEQFQQASFEPEPEPEPVPAPELIAPAPVQVVPAAWDLQPETPAEPEPLAQSDQFDRGPVFQPEQAQQAPVFEPVQQYESVQGLDQWQGADQRNGFAEQQYGQFEQAQQPELQQPFDQPQQAFEQQSYEQPPRVEAQQPESQHNQYDQLFEQQYDPGEMETTRVTGAVPDSVVGQPEQYPQDQYPQGQYQHEQFAQEPFVQGQQEPTDRFDEVPASAVDVVIAIGANLGDPQATMRSAVAELDRMPGLQITDVSPLARTAAIGGPEDQPDYLNAVLLARTTLPARGLLHLCLEVESLHGRTREEHWGPRTLDVDLIAYGTLAAASEDLEVPHPRAHERAFVLEPWSQIAPDAVLPGLGGGPVAQLAATAPDRAGIRWLALDWLTDPEPEQGAGPVAPAEPVAADGGVAPEQEAHGSEMPPALPPSVPPSGRPQASSGGPVVEVPGGGQPQDGSGYQDSTGYQDGAGYQDSAGYQDQHPQGYSSGPVPGMGGSGQIPEQAPMAQRTPPPVGMNGSAVPPPEESLVPAPPIAPRAVRDTAHEAPEHESLPAPGPAKPVFAPVNPSRQPSGVFPPVGGSSSGVQDAANGAPNGQLNGYASGQQEAYDNDHTVIRVPGYATEKSIAQSAVQSDGPIDSVPAWGPVRDERGRDV